MLTMRDHNVEDCATLRDMDMTDVAVLDEADDACLDQRRPGQEVGEALRFVAVCGEVQHGAHLTCRDATGSAHADG